MDGATEMLMPSSWREGVVLLSTAALFVPLLHRLKIPAVLGFIFCGVLIGPFGLGALAQEFPILSLVAITDRHAIAPFAEMGIIFLLFAIGLELSFERLKLLRKLVFGLGAVQTGGSILFIAFFCHYGLKLSGTQSIVVGMALSLSSTAIVMQTLADQQRLTRPEGRAAFGILLFQDLAVVPILFAVTMVAPSHAGAGVLGLGESLLLAAVAVALLIGFGRLALRPLFRQAARTRSPEVFMALCLLVVIITSLITSAAGLSGALGAFLAGLILAETEFRREVEATIEPFKGLLLGVFLVSVGMSVDLGRILAHPILVIAALVGVVGAKFAIVFLGARLFGVKRRPAMEAGLMLGPGGEFAFVVIALALKEKVLTAEMGDFVLLVTAASMCLIPVLSATGQTITKWRAKSDMISVDELAQESQQSASHVIVAGFGRVGKAVVSLLQAHNVPYLVVDADPDNVAAARKAGAKVYYGNAARADYLKACGIERAKALVITMDGGAALESVVRAAHALVPSLPIISRARDGDQAAHLYGLGVREAVPETFEASLQLGEALLVEIGVPMGLVIVSIHEARAAFRDELIAASSATLPSERIRALRGKHP